MANTRPMKVRFFAATKRLTTGDRWPAALPPLDQVADRLAAALPPSDIVDIYENTLVGRVREHRPGEYSHFVFYRIREDLLPALFNGTTGSLDELAIDDEDALAEATDVVMLSTGLVLQLVNRDGPGMGLITRYIYEITKVDIAMVALTHEDPLAQLGQAPELSAVRIRAAATASDSLGQGHDSLRDAGRSAARAEGTKSIEMIYRAEKGQRAIFANTWRQRLRRLAGKPGIERLTATIWNEELRRAEEIDLVLDKITASAFVELTTDNRHITEAAALAAVTAAYETMRGIIDPALEVVLEEERALD